MAKLTIIRGDVSETVDVEQGTKVSDALKLIGASLSLPCGGHGKCGKCRVKASGSLSDMTDGEARLLAGEANGTRLACRAMITGDCLIELEVSGVGDIVTDGTVPDFERDPIFKKLGLAVDIGTTTLAMALFDDTGRIAHAAGRNPQSAFGADVISRVGASIAGNGAALAELVRSAINSLTLDMCKRSGRSVIDIDAVVITGNTAMLYLFSGLDPDALSHAPFAADELFGREYPAKEFGISAGENASLYLARCMASFVGADITCAVLASGMTQKSETSLLTDIGTNGEMALWKDGVLRCCSTAAGPAFEGADISCGMAGVTGAISGVKLVGHEIKCDIIGGGKAAGVCGSGLIDAVRVMLDAGVLDETGLLEDMDDVWADRMTDGADGAEFRLAGNVSLSQRDVRQLQLAKSAICSGMLALAGAGDCDARDIKRLYVAGGFGSFIDLESAGRTGLLPKELVPRAISIGNAALAGASMLLLNGGFAELAENIARNAVEVDLTRDRRFNELFIDNMLFE